MSSPARQDQRGAAGVRVAVVLVVVVAVLVGAFFGVDSYVQGRIERETAAQLQGELGTPQAPSVDVVGTPVLTQLAARRIGEVHLTGDDLGEENGGELKVRHLDMTLRDVTTTDWWQTMTVGTAQGTALVDYDVVARQADVPLTYTGGGRFSVEGSQSLAGVTVAGKITWGLALDVDQQSVSLADPDVEVAGYTLPDVVAEQLVQAVVRPVPIEGIPFDLRVTSIDAEDDGMHVGLAGESILVER